MSSPTRAADTSGDNGSDQLLAADGVGESRVGPTAAGGGGGETCRGGLLAAATDDGCGVGVEDGCGVGTDALAAAGAECCGTGVPVPGSGVMMLTGGVEAADGK